MPKLLIVRHGQSEWNALGRWQGQADPPLTEVGENQAKKATNKLGLFDSIVASPLQRAKNTASIISEITKTTIEDKPAANTLLLAKKYSLSCSILLSNSKILPRTNQALYK